MMVFRHGLGRGRIDMLLIADSFAAAGMVTVAIDAAKHGDRSFCTSGIAGTTLDPVTRTAVGGCNNSPVPATPGVLCNPIASMATQGDAQPPGTCGAGGFAKMRLDGSFVMDPATQDGIPAISGNFLVSANFFRTRDTMRQDLIDESQLIRALALVPPEAAGTHNVVFEHMFGQNLIIDPGAIYYSGQSLGSIQGTMDVATNPRISKAVFNVGGGSIVDIFTNSPAFAPAVDWLLAGIGIQRGTAGFLQFLVVAKTILDPADPINFAGHLTANTLPNLLAGGTPQAAKRVLPRSQIAMAWCPTRSASCTPVTSPRDLCRPRRALAPARGRSSCLSLFRSRSGAVPTDREPSTTASSSTSRLTQRSPQRRRPTRRSS
jgi:hypothetical protein